MRVKSKTDTWISVLLWTSIIIMILTMVLIPQNERLLAVLIGIPIVFLILWILYGTYYELRELHLYCKSGPFSEKIPYDKIKSLRLSQNFASSMALSRQRIEIRQHGKGYITGTTFISPIDRDSFMEELKIRCINLE